MRNSSRAGARTLDAELVDLKQKLQDGIDAITSGEDWRRYLEFQARFPQYSFGNLMLALAQCPSATMLMPRGERADGKHTGWYALGRTVVPGREEAGKIWIWKPYSGKVDDPSRPEGYRTFTKFHQVPVYDVADTEGEPLPEGAPVTLLEGDDPAGLLKLTVEFIEASGFTVEFVPSIPGSDANGDMNPTERRVRICTGGRDPRQQAKTAVHEAAHVVLHSGGKGISIPRSQKEVEAESVAFIVSLYLGVDTGDYSFGYVAGWAADTGFSHRTVLKHSGKRIQLAARKIITAFEGGDGAAEEDPE